MARIIRMIEHVWKTGGGCWAAVGVLLLAVGCGDGYPTAPTPAVDPTPQPPTTVFTLSGQVTDHEGRGVSGATVRVLDGPHEGASVKTGAYGRYALPDLTGNFYVSAMKSGYVDRTAAAGPMETMLDFVVIERGVADYIEALFLGLGPLSPTDGNSGCPDGQYGYWIGWENSNLRVTVSDVVDSAAKRLVERAAAQVSEATAGRYSATYSQTGATNPIPGHAEVRVYPGFPTTFWGLLGFFVGGLMGKALWKLVENEQRFPRRGGRVLCVHGAVSFRMARPCATRWLPGEGNPA